MGNESKIIGEELELLKYLILRSGEYTSEEEVFRDYLIQVCQRFGWDIGHVYLSDLEHPNQLIPTKIWFQAEGQDFRDFRSLTEKTVFQKGVGLPGRVLASGQPAWIEELERDNNFPRFAKMTARRVISALGIPVIHKNQTLAVLEFFATKKRKKEGALLSLADSISRQLGHILETVKVLNHLSRSTEDNLALTSRLELALDGAFLGIWDWNLESNEVEFDRRWCEMLGLEYASTKMELSTWECRVHPEDLPGAYADIQSYLNGETPFYENRHRMKHQDGSWRWILDRGRFSAWGKNGKPVRFTGTHLDLTKSVEQEQRLEVANKRLELALEASEIGVWDWNIKDNILTWDARMYAIYGILQPDSVEAYEAWFSGVLDVDKERVQKEIQDAVDGVREFNTEFSIILDGGEVRKIRARSSVIRNAEGEALNMVGVNWDVTDQYIRESQLKFAQQEAEQSSKSKSNFLAAMSHEIRTPLNGILSCANLLLDRKQDSDSTRLLTTVISCGDSLLTVINDILDFSKFEAGKVLLENNSFDFCLAIEELIELMRPKAEAEGKTLSLVFGDEVYRWVLGDVTRLKQVILNCIGNAIKFSASKIEVDVSAAYLKPGLQQITVKIHDDGVGIPSDKAGRLFHPFTQIDGTTTRNFGGTGLGLAIARSLMDALGGEIWFESEEGKYTTFFISWSAAEGEEVDQSASIPLSSMNPNMGINHPLKILLAEDNSVNQMVIRDMLARFNYRVDIAQNGLEVLKAMESSRYDIILMDQHMPEMDGVEATRMICSMYPEKDRPRIVALTASVMDEDRQRCLAAGMDGFLVKPVNISKVLLELSNTPANPHGIFNQQAGSIDASMVEETGMQEPTADEKRNPQSGFVHCERLKNEFMGAWDILGRVIEQFVHELPEYIGKIENQFQAQDLDGTKLEVHTLKGVIANFQAESLVNALAQIEDAVKQGELQTARADFEAMKPKLERLTHELIALGDSLRKVG